MSVLKLQENNELNEGRVQTAGSIYVCIHICI